MLSFVYVELRTRNEGCGRRADAARRVPLCYIGANPNHTVVQLSYHILAGLCHAK
jgi:hypothetical protein